MPETCAHELVLNGACYYCGATDLDPQVHPERDVIPAERLRRKRPEPAGDPPATAPERSPGRKR